MAETPLKTHLDACKITAQKFADDNGFIPASVRYWVRGDKEPTFAMQLEIERSSGGAVTPAMWLGYKLENSSRPTDAAAA